MRLSTVRRTIINTSIAARSLSWVLNARSSVPGP